MYAMRRFKGIAKGYIAEWFGKHRMFVEHSSFEGPRTFREHRMVRRALDCSKNAECS